MSDTVVIQVSSGTYYENLIAEVLIDGKRLFLISNEKGEFEIEMFGVDERLNSIKVARDRMYDAINEACARLVIAGK
jgi:hypothetical protein